MIGIIESAYLEGQLLCGSGGEGISLHAPRACHCGQYLLGSSVDLRSGISCNCLTCQYSPRTAQSRFSRLIC